MLSNLKINRKPPPPPEDSPHYSTECGSASPDLIGRHLNDLVYVWMKYGNSFWMCPVDKMGDVLFCYAWDGTDWKYILMKTSLIDTFC